MRAFSVLNPQSTLAPTRLRSLHQALASRSSVSMSANLRLRHCLTKTEISTSTMFSHEPCTGVWTNRSEEHTSELQPRQYLVCRLLVEKKTRTSLLARKE